MCLTPTSTPAQRVIQHLRDLRMAGMEIENEFPNLFFEYMAASGIPDGEAAGMLLDVAAESQRTGRVLPREVGWLGH